MATVEELEEQIFNPVTSLRNSKKQPNEDTIYCIISKTKTTKSLNKETLQETLNKLVNSKKLKVKLHNGKNLYYVENDSCHEDINKYQVIENVIKTCSHLIMKLPYRKITLKHQKGNPS